MEGVQESVQSNWAVFGNDTEKGGDADWSVSVNSKIDCLQDPLERTRLESGDSDEWQDFTSMGGQGKNESFTDSKSLCGKNPSVGDTTYNGLPDTTQVKLLNSTDSFETTSFAEAILKDCFPVPTECPLPDRRQDVCIQQDESLLSKLRVETLSVSNFKWSRCLIKDQFLLMMLALEEEKKAEGKVLEELDLSGYDEYDWSLPPEMETLPKRHHSIDCSDSESDGGLWFSPDEKGMQGLLRGPCSGMDSPIQIEFDYGKAVLGLSMLSRKDLQMMKDEMATKVAKQSNELVILLQSRDVLQLETVTKNKFIQALLKVKECKHAIKNSVSLGSLGATGGGDSSTGNRGTAKDEDRPRSRSRTRSLQNLSKSISHTIARAKNLLPVEEDKKSSDMLLHVVIPYRENMGASLSVPLLTQWTKNDSSYRAHVYHLTVLQAIVERSPNVSNLISDYLKMALDPEPRTTQNHEQN